MIMMSHDLIKIPVENSLLLNSVILIVFSLITIATIKKTEPKSQSLLSLIDTAQLKGIAVILIVMYHLSVYTIENADDLILFRHGDIIGLSIFLILSGFGIASSIESKGLDNFFSKKLIKIYPPFVIVMSLELLLNNLFYIDKNPGIVRIVASAMGFLPVDRNM